MQLKRYTGLAIGGGAFLVASLGALFASFGYENLGAVLIRVAFPVFVVGFLVHIIVPWNSKR